MIYRHSMKMIPPRSRHGFTLLEICVVMALAVLMLSLAVPSLRGQMTRQRLQKSFDQLDLLVSQAREHAMTEGKPFLLAWDKNGTVQLYPAELGLAARRKQGPAAELAGSVDAGHYTLFRPSALTAQPSAEWTFWPSGTCEPVIVKYAGKVGEWEAHYNALSGRGDLTRFIAQ